MGVLGSRLDPGSDAYRANRAANLELLAELERLLAQARAGDRKSTRLNSSHTATSRMPSSA